MPGGTTGLRPPRPALPLFRAELALCRGLYSWHWMTCINCAP